MRRRLLALGCFTVMAATPVSARAQGFTREIARELKDALKDIPKAHLPPPGMCRIWLDGVPPGQQPAPTDCATAVRNRPANARVIFNDEKKDDGRSPARKDKDDDRKDDDRRPDPKKKP